MIRTAVVLLSIALGWVFQIDPAICNGCGLCIPWCPEGAITMQGSDAVINPEICNGCGICEMHCPRGAIYKSWYSSTPEDSPEIPAIHPNPTAGVFRVSSQDDATVSVYSVSGRLVESRAATSPSTTVDLGSMVSGVYLVLVDDDPAGLVVVRR